MATTTLAEIFRPSPFARLAQAAQIELNRFLASGVGVRDPIITERLGGGVISTGISLPSYDSLGINEPNYSTDVTGDKSVPKNITSPFA